MTKSVVALSIAAVLAICGPAYTQDASLRTQSRPDSSAMAFSEEAVRFPSLGDRILVLGLAVLTVGGLALMFDQKRRRADSDAGL